MDPTRLMTQTATLRHRTQDGTVDIYGDSSWTAATTTVQCLALPSASEETTVRGVLVTAEMNLAVPPATVIGAEDEIDLDGTTWQVSGPPHKAWNPRLQRYTHIECVLRRAG